MNPFDDPLKGLREKEPPVVEGFICPECMKKFSTMTELMRHVEGKCSTAEQVRVPSRDQSMEPKKTRLFGKFRRRRHSSSSNSTTVMQNVPADVTAVFPPNGYNHDLDTKRSNPKGSPIYLHSEDEFAPLDLEPEVDEPTNGDQETITQPSGTRRSRWDFFKQHRDNRTERNELFTNKLIIRLDRILTGYPELNDFYKRKAHEQTVVQWMPANLVANCPICTAKFGVFFGNAGGRHHCRLCGCVMCFRCSKFYTFEYAHRLVKPADLKSKLPTPSEKPKMNLTSVGKVLSYLNIELNPEFDRTHWNQLRICLLCDHLLTIRCTKLQPPTTHPIEQTYSLIAKLKQEIENSTEVYRRMARSLQKGEQDYKLMEARKLQAEIGLLCEQMRQLSEKIAQMQFLPSDTDSAIDDLEERQSLAQRNVTIQANIRCSVIDWCQRYALTLPAIPSEQEYEVLKEKHEGRIQRRIYREKAILLQEQQYSEVRQRLGKQGNPFA